MTRPPWVFLAGGCLALEAVVGSDQLDQVLVADDLSLQDAVLEALSKNSFGQLLLSSASPELWVEARQRLDALEASAQEDPQLALAAGQALYVFGWFDPVLGDVEMARRAARLFLTSLIASGCDKPMALEQFLDLSCEIRWIHAVMLRDHAGERTDDLLAHMQRLPRYSRVQWTRPSDVNLNELFFPGTARPVWDRGGSERDPRIPRIPFAEFLEAAAPEIMVELEAAQQVPGLLERLHSANDAFEHHSLRDEWLHVGLVRYLKWYTEACEVFPRTCALLASRSEVTECQNVNALLIRLLPGRGLKPHFGNAPRLSAHLALSAAAGAWMQVGPEVVTWSRGKAVVFDDTFRHRVVHEGTEPRYVLNVCFCHPCDRRHYQPEGYVPPCEGAAAALPSAIAEEL